VSFQSAATGATDATTGALKDGFEAMQVTSTYAEDFSGIAALTVLTFFPLSSFFSFSFIHGRLFTFL